MGVVDFLEIEIVGVIEDYKVVMFGEVICFFVYLVWD